MTLKNTRTLKPLSSPLRKILRTTAIVASVAVVAGATFNAASSGNGDDARAQLTLIAPAGAGGGWDGAAREAQQAMRAQSIVNNAQVVNIPGAGGTIGLNKFAGMDGEKSSLMVMGITMLGAININGSQTTIQDVTPIARITDDYDVLVVPADSPYNSVDELLTDWGKDPNSFAFGGGSLGSVDQMIVTQLAQHAGIQPTAVNYIAYSGGGELATSLLSGTIKASVSGWVDFADQIEAGKLKALAVSAPEPVPATGVSTLKELGYDIELTNWRGIVAPPGLSDQNIKELQQIVTETVNTPQWADALERNQWADTFLTGPEFEEFLESERQSVDAIWNDLGY
ncbi:tripartite tricarboxylate transporter substrate binding protein [Arthrobacter sp. NIO-1057]|uniref:tripartite tricarboxylate transporter substrate binding protein n=1 Tax=Arthrobacter sp. NIO-1057 TaxID=993071 RepID=UPI00071E3B92|nr:tripartite tricarboxylate transporter substrate-binding protein [Arthrobacter sp. NIO-1057]KSU63058.1 tricarboxylic transporter [Arthrobacter sp. NIO-1057]SCC52978.1 putative tricarboxylic transport membrane protein [Arthrobacter sp. NIO-1057]